MGLFLLLASSIGWKEPRDPWRNWRIISIAVDRLIGVVVLLIVVLTFSGAARRRLADELTGRTAPPSGVADNRLHWSPWGSVPLDDLTGVRPAHYARGGWTQILLDRRSSILSPTIHTGLYAISRDDLIRAIEALKPGLRYPDEPV